MPCYHPITGYLCQDGRFRMTDIGDCRVQSIPCGQCVGCRLEYSRQWAVRCMHEASLYSSNCLITLTFSPENMPSNNSLDYVYFQDFMKRLRSVYQGADLVSHPYAGAINSRSKLPYPDFYRPIRFYMCGEYGEKRARPHFHACLFNFDFPDKKLWRRTSQGHSVWRSSSLESLWSFGFSEIGSVNFQSAAYVARYIMKKANGRLSDVYDFVDPSSGEVISRTPEFTRMSLKPGIAEGWLRKYMSDVYPHDYIIVNGRKCKPPRYYDKKYFQSTSVTSSVENYLSSGQFIGMSDVDLSSDFDELVYARELSSLSRLEDNTSQRLYSKELVALDRVSKLSRSLT